MMTTTLLMITTKMINMTIVILTIITEITDFCKDSHFNNDFKIHGANYTLIINQKQYSCYRDY